MNTTRDRAIARHITLALKHTELTRESYADDVVRIYHERTPLNQRHIEFHVLARGGDVYTVLRANAQLVFRQVDGTTRMACELEEAMVLALPDPYRSGCLADLAERYGLLAAAAPATELRGQVSQIGALTKEFADVLQGVATTMADGRLDGQDVEHAAEVVRQVDELIAAATTVRAAHLVVLNAVQGLLATK